MQGIADVGGRAEKTAMRNIEADLDFIDELAFDTTPPVQYTNYFTNFGPMTDDEFKEKLRHSNNEISIDVAG